MIISCWGARYRDLLQIGSYGSQLLFYGTPIIYSMKSVPEKLHFLFYFNPLTYFIEYFRFVFFNTELPHISYLITGIIFLIFVSTFSLYTLKKIIQKILLIMSDISIQVKKFK